METRLFIIIIVVIVIWVQGVNSAVQTLRTVCGSEHIMRRVREKPGEGWADLEKKVIKNICEQMKALLWTHGPGLELLWVLGGSII